MNDLVQIVNRQAVVNSKQVADSFGKQHKHVLEAIRELSGLAENSADLFQTISLADTYGRPQPAFLMNRDGFSLLVMGFTGKEALEWKLKYIKAFNEMEAELNKPLSPLEILAAQAQALVDQDKKIKELDNKVQSIRDVVALSPTEWRKNASKLISKMSRNQYGDFSGIQGLYEESYDLLNQRMGVDVFIRLENKRRRMSYEGVPKSKVNQINVLDVIADDKKLVEGYLSVIKDMSIRYGADIA